MDKKITNELIEERTNLYIEENWDDIIADIDKRVEREVKTVIKDMFSSNSWERKDNAIKKYIKGKIETIVQEQVDKTEIDTDEIARLVQKRAMQQAKKARLIID